MKKNKLILFIPLLFTFSIFSQSGWVIHNSGTNQHLSSVFFTDLNTGYIAGAGYTILKTTNAGLNWINISISGINNFSSIYFIQNTGYVVSFNGGIYKTTNGGLNWSQQISGTNFNSYNVFFIDSDTGYIGGDTGDPPNSIILKTTNGGITWQSLSLPNPFYSLRSMYFINYNTGYAAGSVGRIIKTTTGGASWSFQDVLPVTNFFLSIYFANLNTGYVVGGETAGGTIFKTTNSGTTWINQISGLTDNLFSVFVPVQIGSDTVFTVGNHGKILKTINGGVSWNYQISGTTNYLSSVFFINTLTGYSVGSNGTILKTTTSGLTVIQPISSEIPKAFSLSQNYPNPFNPSTTIKFDIPKAGIVTLKIYDIIGKEIYTINEFKTAGQYEFTFDASNYASGLYFYKLVVGDNTNNGGSNSGQGFALTKKMVLVK